MRPPRVAAALLLASASAACEGNAPVRDDEAAARVKATCGAGVRGVLQLKTVEKGLNNQRLRFVQEIVVAALAGSAVELPALVRTRRGCHFKKTCPFEEAPFDAVYDRTKLRKALAAAGVCVLPKRTRGPVRRLKVAFPVKASAIERAPQKPRGVFALPPGCCTMLVADSKRSAELLVKVNAAFATASRFLPAAQRVRDAFGRAAARDDRDARVPLVALHWRIDDDFTSSSRGRLTHALDARKARRATCDALTRHARGTRPLHVLLLGDFSRAKMRAVRTAMTATCTSLNLRLHSKETLLGGGLEQFAAGPSGGDDVKGQLDFELGLTADAFVGAPFSSFSVLIASARLARRQPSEMIAVDTRDRLGRLMKAHVPYSREEYGSNAQRRPARVAAVVPQYKGRLLGAQRADFARC